ncbi:MAG TPA: BON domain-containing protein [Acidimicrobiales bacterium]|jgi:osmotically-inducible protein OsmY|nr:BON domain-containing protein [Acidimicrobiales bacterium]
MGWINRSDRTYYRWTDVPDAEAPPDREMKSTLVHRLRENPFTQDSSIKVDVSDRTIVLGGEVGSPEAEQVAVEDAWDTPGVVDVDNELVVSAAGGR